MNQNLFVLFFIVVLVVAALLWRSRRVTVIYPPNVGLLYHSGKFDRELGPGRYVMLDPFDRTKIVKVSRAPLPQQLGEVTVVSQDQFSFRVGLAPIVEVIDARTYAESQNMIEPPLFGGYMVGSATPVAMLSLGGSSALEVVASHALRDLIAQPRLLAAEIQEKLADTIPGARVLSVLVTSITLPPETRKMFTDVERSKIEAEVALERARGEQTALRALANAARLIKDNPALANLRFLQTLEQAPGAKTIVLGSDAVAPLVGRSSG